MIIPQLLFKKKKERKKICIDINLKIQRLLYFYKFENPFRGTMPISISIINLKFNSNLTKNKFYYTSRKYFNRLLHL